MKKTAVLLLLLASCATGSYVEQLGSACRREDDWQVRRDLVAKIMDTGNPDSIPILIDCLAVAIAEEKKPEWDRSKPIVRPESAGPELWGLYVLTDQQFGHDIQKWRAWYTENAAKLYWDPPRRWRVRE